ncbi:MAG: hypothetical protein GX413_11135 [Acetobacter sp.]|nr:hypothetical protein [Acetobacter sp.]
MTPPLIFGIRIGDVICIRASRDDAKISVMECNAAADLGAWSIGAPDRAVVCAVKDLGGLR